MLVHLWHRPKTVCKFTHIVSYFIDIVVATSVASAADREMKRIVGNEDWNNAPVIRKMYSIFQGTVSAGKVV